jgi:hypothetical protein
VRSRRFKALILITPLLVGTVVAGFSLAAIRDLPDSYASSAALVFSPVATKLGTLPGSETVVLAANNSLSVIASSEARTAVGEIAGITVEEVADATKATVIPGTSTVAITVTRPTAASAWSAADAYLKVVEEKYERNRNFSVSATGAASRPTVPTGPPRKLLSGLVLTLGLVTTLLTFALLIALVRLRAAGGLLERLVDLSRTAPGAADDAGADPDVTDSRAPSPR